MTTRVALERGRTWTFASALDWPGWCRRAKTRAGDEAALEALLEYADRYAAVVGAGVGVAGFEVVGAVDGDATTDFGAPAVPGPWDDEPIDEAEAARQATLLRACWTALDAVAADAPEQLAKGPRGGGRDRTKMLDHVREAERAYARRLGVAVPPRTPWERQRSAITDLVSARAADAAWPLRYGVRRIAWHVLDHAWEMQDRTPRPTPPPVIMHASARHRP
ncbi:MAG: hypothetical protein ACTHLJ_02905 [Angustibacter sp.]